MGWPQYAYAALMLVGLGVQLARHGQPRTGDTNFWIELLGVSIVFGLTYAGGFWGALQ